MDKTQQELLFKLSMFEQQIQNLQQQLRAVEEGMIDIGTLKEGLDEIKNSVGREIVAPLGRGIFVNAKLSSDDLIVDVGGRNLVKKSVQETKEIIGEQLKKLEEIRKEINLKLDETDKELTRIISEAAESEDNKNKG